MTAVSVVDTELDVSRRRPNPGYRVAPPVTDAYGPWVSALDEELEAGDYQWVLGADGALVPVPVAEQDEPVTRAKRRLFGRRTQ